MRSALAAAITRAALATALAATAVMSIGMAHQLRVERANAAILAQIDLGLDGVTTPPATPYVLVAIISKDGALVEARTFVRGGEPVVFDSKEACVAFTLLPFFPQIAEGLDEFVAKNFPGAKAEVSCVAKS